MERTLFLTNQHLMLRTHSELRFRRAQNNEIYGIHRMFILSFLRGTVPFYGF